MLTRQKPEAVAYGTADGPGSDTTEKKSMGN